MGGGSPVRMLTKLCPRWATTCPQEAPGVSIRSWTEGPQRPEAAAFPTSPEPGEKNGSCTTPDR